MTPMPDGRPRTSPGRCCAPCVAITPSRRAWSSWPRRSGWASTRAAPRCRPSASSPSGSACRGPPCARRWRPCARPDWSRPRRGRGGGTVSPSGRGPRPGARRPASPTASVAEWLDALEFRRVVEPGAAELAARGRPRRPTAGPAREGPRRGAAARRPAQHRQADSRFHLTVATLTGSPRMIEAVTSVQSSCTRCCWRSRSWTPTSPTPTGSTPLVVRAILAGQAGPGPPGHGGALRRHGRAAARPRGLGRPRHDPETISATTAT